MASYQVTSVSADEVPDAAGNLVDSYDVTFTVGGSSTPFTVVVPRAGDPVAAAQSAIEAIVAQVDGILGLGGA